MLRLPRLYGITDSQLTPADQLEAAVAAALAGGTGWIQYRDKHSPQALRLHQAQTLRRLCDQAGGRLIINDDVDLALAVGADGVHLGQGDTPLAEARMRLGPDRIIGITCHASLELAQAAARDGADYLALGRFFPSNTKPGAPAAPQSIIPAVQALGLPLVVIGGIGLHNAPALLAFEPLCLAVCEGLFAAPDIRDRARQFLAL